ncbi:hypothetical protein HOLleu_40361 [Holothuria leucospilota]|uniref:DUF5050 domain-containing protein n=1 Tax=Holothuria leucospilota TaxID=206669 RepID=A0A9Q1BDJ8_HOLLE|nr:hypothetical protein HOLleu_40361 [Holothuria leucospilota]
MTVSPSVANVTMLRIWIPLLCLVFPLVVWAEFDEPIDGPTGMSFFFDFRRNHLMVYNVPSGDLQSYLYVPAYDVAYWPKEKAMLYTYNGLEIREFNIWGDLNDTLIIDREMLGDSEYWVYVRLEVREDWILGGAIDISTSRLNLYRLKRDPKEGSYNVTLLASENVLSSKNLVIHPTLSPSTRHVYAVGEFGIFRVSYDGGDSELVLADEFAINPTVIESEHVIYFVTGQDRNIVRSCDLDGGNLKTLYTSSVRVGAADKYGEWLVISEENGVKEYQFINLNTNETNKILNVPYDGSDYLVGRLDFWGIREECRTYSLIQPAVITTSTRRNVTITTAISSAGNVSYQYFSSFDRLRFTGTGFELPDTAKRRFNQLDPAALLLPRNDENRAERQGVYLHKIVTPFGNEETIIAVLQSPGNFPSISLKSNHFRFVIKLVTLTLIAKSGRPDDGPLSATPTVLQRNVRWFTGEISFEKSTITASLGDTVHLSVPKPHFIRLRWRRNGRMVRKWSHQGSITLYNVTMKDSGIYESHLTTLRSLGNHAIMRLIVRGIPSSGFYLFSLQNAPQVIAIHRTALKSAQRVTMAAFRAMILYTVKYVSAPQGSWDRIVKKLLIAAHMVNMEKCPAQTKTVAECYSARWTPMDVRVCLDTWVLTAKHDFTDASGHEEGDKGTDFNSQEFLQDPRRRHKIFEPGINKRQLLEGICMLMGWGNLDPRTFYPLGVRKSKYERLPRQHVMIESRRARGHLHCPATTGNEISPPP